MRNSPEKLAELLAFYGADPDRWPADAQPMRMEIRRDPRLARMLEQEQRLESLLRKRPAPMPAHDFLRRVINAPLESGASPASFPPASDIMPHFRPAAIVAMLVVGFALGFGIITHAHLSRDPLLARTSADDEGTIL